MNNLQNRKLSLVSSKKSWSAPAIETIDISDALGNMVGSRCDYKGSNSEKFQGVCQHGTE